MASWLKHYPKSNVLFSSYLCSSPPLTSFKEIVKARVTEREKKRYDQGTLGHRNVWMLFFCVWMNDILGHVPPGSLVICTANPQTTGDAHSSDESKKLNAANKKVTVKAVTNWRIADTVGLLSQYNRMLWRTSLNTSLRSISSMARTDNRWENHIQRPCPLRPRCV